VQRVRQREVLLEAVLLLVKERKVSFPGEVGCGAKIRMHDNNWSCIAELDDQP